MSSHASLLLVLLIPSIALSDVPQSIIGTWQFHGVRLPCMEADPEHPNCPPVQELCAAASNLPANLELTFTESTVGTAGKKIPYRMLGGNSALVIVESITDTGQAFITNVRLVEGGIAIQSLDCRVHREQCERGYKEATKEAMKLLNERQAKDRANGIDPRPITHRGPALEIEDAIDGVLPPDFNKPPVWIYYKNKNQEPCEEKSELRPTFQSAPVVKPEAGLGDV